MSSGLIHTPDADCNTNLNHPDPAERRNIRIFKDQPGFHDR